MPLPPQIAVDSPAWRTDASDMNRLWDTLLFLLRLALLAVLFFLVLSLVIAIGQPGTGPIEKGLLTVGVLALLLLAAPVHAIRRRV